ncbi:MAG TPA: hypothetical protein VMW43_01440 [Bacteroidota bacterium]|nr:hypothetical protein [Bacteroidota bacterium]
MTGKNRTWKTAFGLPAFILLGVTAFGAFLRLSNLGAPSLWIDEALFAGWVQGTPHQEFPTLLLAKLLPTDEFYLRLPVAVAGSLTIAAFYYVTGQGWKSLYGAAFIAVFPVFVFWSRVARPYAFAGLFIVLGWRWWWFYIVAVLTTPAALIGVNLLRLREPRYRLYYAGLLALAIGVYLFRPDVKQAGDFFDPYFLITQKRFWYVPILALLLYICSGISDKHFTPDSTKKIRRS